MSETPAGNARLLDLVQRAEASALLPTTNRRNRELLKELCFALVALAQLVAKQQAPEPPRIVTP
jgi:hypothetical protein